MTMTMTHGYIITDRTTECIYGAGLTVEDAWENLKYGADPFRNAHGDELSDDDAFARHTVFPATEALLAQVHSSASAEHMWGYINGVACTKAEEDAAEKLPVIDQHDRDGEIIGYAANETEAAAILLEAYKRGDPDRDELANFDSTANYYTTDTQTFILISDAATASGYYAAG